MNAQTTHQAANTVQTAMQRAILDANEKATEKTPPSTNVANIGNANALKAIVCRRDILGNALVFDVDSHVKTSDGEFIDYWDGKGTGMKTAPIQYYKVSKPMPAADSVKLSESYAKAMKLSQVHVRQRLVKDHVADRGQDGSISKEAQDAWKETMKAKFKAAFDRAIDEAFANM